MNRGERDLLSLIKTINGRDIIFFLAGMVVMALL